MALPYTEELLTRLLSRIAGVSGDSGTATDGTNTTLEDTTKGWETDRWKDGDIHIHHDGIEYIRTISANTADTVTFAALPGGVAPAAGDSYEIRRIVVPQDITDRPTRLLGVIYGSQGQQIRQRADTFDLIAQLRHAGAEIDPRAIRALTTADVLTVQSLTQWGGVALTGRNISGDLQALTDNSIKGIFKSIGDIAALENIITRIGQTSDAIVAAGAVGSINAKLRRVTQGLEDLKTLITLSELPDTLSAGGNLKMSHEEAAIAVPSDIQARYYVKTTRDIAPAAVGTFWLPASGSIDLSNFIHSSWYIYAPTTANMIVNCYLNISHDGGTTWRRATGYDILDASFVRDVWNSIDVPLMLCEAKLEVVIGTAFPAELDLMCIRKA